MYHTALVTSPEVTCDIRTAVPQEVSQYDAQVFVEAIVMPSGQLLRMAMTLPDPPRSEDWTTLYGDKQ